MEFEEHDERVAPAGILAYDDRAQHVDKIQRHREHGDFLNRNAVLDEL